MTSTLLSAGLGQLGGHPKQQLLDLGLGLQAVQTGQGEAEVCRAGVHPQQSSSAGLQEHRGTACTQSRPGEEEEEEEEGLVKQTSHISLR